MNRIFSYIQRLTTSKTAQYITIVVSTLVAILSVRSCQEPKIKVEVPSLIQTPQEKVVVRPGDDLNPPKPRPETPPKTNSPPPVLAPIHFAVSNPPPPVVTGPVLPAYRLIPCKLVNTVDSSSLDTPIIALVTRDIFWGGELMVPEGTEVHGRAQAHHLRDRVGSQGGWTLIWEDGQDVSINGLALDMDEKEDAWGPTDGSAGLKGTRERSGNIEEVKLFAATFLSGLTQPLQQRRNTLLGSEVLPNMQNAALSGVGEVMEAYGERLLRAIEGENSFVRVAGGKAFYLYTLDPIYPPLITPSTNAPSAQP